MAVKDTKRRMKRWEHEAGVRVRMAAAGVLMGLTAGFLWDAPSIGFGIFYVVLFTTAAIYVYAQLLRDRPSVVVSAGDVVAEDPDHEVEDDSEPGPE